jgi:hypothetical protein
MAPALTATAPSLRRWRRSMFMACLRRQGLAQI